MVGLIILVVAAVVFISIVWAAGIDMMKQQHPDYKGEEFLNWDRKHDDWDDNKIHTEGDF